MDKPISVGDLVVVVHSHCDDKLGLVARVERLRQAGSNLRCNQCMSRVGPPGTHCAVIGSDVWPLGWLRRIPPLDELENSEWADKLDVRQPA